MDRTALAGSWAAHLRAGGTTPWPAWSPERDDQTSPSAGLPGAAQLELLRLVNAEGGPVPDELADHVLRRPGPGRGIVHLELPSPPAAAAPVDEVLRVGAGVLADLAVRLPPVVHRPLLPPPASRAPRTPSFALDGTTVTVADLRAGLAVAGRFEHRPTKRWFRGTRDLDPDVLLLVVGPLDRMLHEVWTRRVQEGSVRPWARLVTSWVQRDVLPPSAEVDRTADEWAARIGPSRVHVVTTDGLEAQVAEVLGDSAVAAGLAQPHLPGDPARLAPAAADVLRRVNGVLPFVVPEREAGPPREALAALAAEVGPSHGGLTVPNGQRAWVARRAAGLAEGLSGYRVHGDLELLGRPTQAPVRPDRDDTLAAMVRMIRLADRTARSADGGNG